MKKLLIILLLFAIAVQTCSIIVATKTGVEMVALAEEKEDTGKNKIEKKDNKDLISNKQHHQCVIRASLNHATFMIFRKQDPSLNYHTPPPDAGWC